MIRAVDLAMPVQRATEMTQSQRGENRPDLLHQQFAARLSKETDLQQQQVQQTPESEEAQIQKDGRGSGGQGENRRGKKGKKEQEVAKPKRVSDSMFDISL